MHVCRFVYTSLPHPVPPPRPLLFHYVTSGFCPHFLTVTDSSAQATPASSAFHPVEKALVNAVRHA